MVSDLFYDHRRVPTMSVAPMSSASTPTTWDTPRFAPSPSDFHCSCSPDLHRAAEGRRRWPDASPCPYRRSSALEPSLKVTKHPMPLISHSLPILMCNCSPQHDCAAAIPLCHRPPTSSAFASVSCPRPRLPCQPEPSCALPSAPGPLAWPRSRL
jgi:hypothetical protein